MVKLKFIKDAQSLGYSLKEIQAALALLGSKMDEDTLKELVRDKITEIDEKGCLPVCYSAHADRSARDPRRRIFRIICILSRFQIRIIEDKLSHLRSK
ncbi:MerR family DNA-binding protein [Paenibacillus rhizoplanae]